MRAADPALVALNTTPEGTRALLPDHRTPAETADSGADGEESCLAFLWG